MQTAHSMLRITVLYFDFLPVWNCHIFPRYLINGKIFEKKKLNIFFLYSLQLLVETFLVLRRIQWDIIKHVPQVLKDSTRNSCQILIKPEFSRQTFKKNSNIEFRKNSPYGSRILPRGQTGGWPEGRTGMMEIIMAFRNFANMPNKLSV